jgi:hypothetical protein
VTAVLRSSHFERVGEENISFPPTVSNTSPVQSESAAY